MFSSPVEGVNAGFASIPIETFCDKFNEVDVREPAALFLLKKKGLQNYKNEISIFSRKRLKKLESTGWINKENKIINTFYLVLQKFIFNKEEETQKMQTIYLLYMHWNYYSKHF